jgi:putative transposase
LLALTIAAKRHWLWRAVDEDGFVLDVLVQRRRDCKGARRLIRTLMKAVTIDRERRQHDA